MQVGLTYTLELDDCLGSAMSSYSGALKEHTR